MNAGQLALHLARLIVSGWGVHSAAEDLATQFSSERIGNPTTVRFTPLQAAVLNVLLGIRDRPMSSGARAHFRKRAHAVFVHIEKALAPLYAEPTAAAKKGLTPPFDVRSYVPPSALDSIPVSIVDARPPMKREPDEPLPADIELARESKPHTVTQIPARYLSYEDDRAWVVYDAHRALLRMRPEEQEQAIEAEQWFRNIQQWEHLQNIARQHVDERHQRIYFKKLWRTLLEWLERADFEAVRQQKVGCPDNLLAAITWLMRSEIAQSNIKLYSDDAATMLWIDQLPTSRHAVTVGERRWYHILRDWASAEVEGSPGATVYRPYLYGEMQRDSYSRLGALTALRQHLHIASRHDPKDCFTSIYFMSRLLAFCGYYARQSLDTMLESVVFRASDPFVDALHPAQIRQERPGFWALSYVGEAAPTDPVDIALYEFGRLSGPSWYDVAARLLIYRDVESILMFNDVKAAIPFWPRKSNPSSRSADVQELLGVGRCSNPVSNDKSIVNFVTGQPARVAEQVVQLILQRVRNRVAADLTQSQQTRNTAFVTALRERVRNRIDAFVAPFWLTPHYKYASVNKEEKRLHVPLIDALWLGSGPDLRRVDDIDPVVTPRIVRSRAQLSLAVFDKGFFYKVDEEELEQKRQTDWRMKADPERLVEQLASEQSATVRRPAESTTQPPAVTVSKGETQPDSSTDATSRPRRGQRAPKPSRKGWVEGTTQFDQGKLGSATVPALLRGQWALVKTRGGYNITHVNSGKQAFPVRTADEAIHAMNELLDKHPELEDMIFVDEIVKHKPLGRLAQQMKYNFYQRRGNPSVSEYDSDAALAGEQEMLNFERWSNPARDGEPKERERGEQPDWFDSEYALVSNILVPLIVRRVRERVTPNSSGIDRLAFQYSTEANFLIAVEERIVNAIDAFVAPYWGQPVWSEAKVDTQTSTVVVPEVDAFVLSAGRHTVNYAVSPSVEQLTQLVPLDVQLSLAYRKDKYITQVRASDLTPELQRRWAAQAEKRLREHLQEQANKVAEAERKSQVSARTSLNGFYTWPGQTAFERERALKPVMRALAERPLHEYTVEECFTGDFQSPLTRCYALLKTYSLLPHDRRMIEGMRMGCFFEFGFYAQTYPTYHSSENLAQLANLSAIEIDENVISSDLDDLKTFTKSTSSLSGKDSLRERYNAQVLRYAGNLIDMAFLCHYDDGDWSDGFRFTPLNGLRSMAAHHLRQLVRRELQPDRDWRTPWQRALLLWLAAISVGQRFHEFLPRLHFALSSHTIVAFDCGKHLLQTRKIEFVIVRDSNNIGDWLRRAEEKERNAHSGYSDLLVLLSVLHDNPIINLDDVLHVTAADDERLEREAEQRQKAQNERTQAALREPPVTGPPGKKITPKELLRMAHESKKELLASTRPPAPPPAPKPSRIGFVSQDVVLAIRKDRPPQTIRSLVRGAWAVCRVDGQWNVTHAPTGYRAFDVRRQDDGIAAINEVAETLPDILNESDPAKLAKSKEFVALARRENARAHAERHRNPDWVDESSQSHEQVSLHLADTYRQQNPDEPPVATGAFRNEPGVTTPLLWTRTFEAWQAVEETEQGHLSQDLLVEAIFEKLRSFQVHIHAYADANRELWQDHVRKRVRELLIEKLTPHFHQRFIRPQKEGRAPQVCRVEGVAPWLYIHGKPFFVGLLADDGFVYSASVVRAGSSPEAFALFERATLQQSAGKKADATEVVGLVTPEEQRRFLLNRVPQRGLDALPRNLAKQITESIHAWWRGEAQKAVDSSAITHARHDAVVSHFYYEHKANPNRGVTEQAPCALTLKLGSSEGTIALTFWGFTHDGRSTLEALGLPQTLAYVGCEAARRFSQYPSQDVRDKITSFIGTAEEVTNAALSDVVKVLSGWYDAATHTALGDTVARRYKIFGTSEQATAETIPIPSAPAPERQLAAVRLPESDALRERFLAHVSTPPGDMHGRPIPSESDALRLAWQIRDALNPWMHFRFRPDRSELPDDARGEFAKERGKDRRPSLDARLTLDDAPEFMRVVYEWRNDETADKFLLSVTLSGFANGQLIVPTLLACTDISYEKTYIDVGGRDWKRLREKWLPDMLVASPDEVMQTVTGIITTNLDKAEVPRRA
jgi:hypothetical protein